MGSVKLTEGVYWVGAIDWDVRNFHGLTSPQGSTYNAYLVVDEKIALIDSVRPPETEILLRHISEIVDPARIDYVISNHSEPDHSGALGAVMEAAPSARLYASKEGVKRLEKMFRAGWDMVGVGDSDELPLGNKTLKFINAPLLHWPETMFTYCPEAKVLFACDAFGAHIASSERFVDELGIERIMPYTKKYFAFLIASFRKAALQAMKKIDGLPIDFIGPSHGPVWRGEDIPKMLGAYAAWATLQLEPKATIVYGSMWGGTRAMAKAVADGVMAAGLQTRVFDIDHSDLSDIIAETFDSRLVLLGSPTFVSGIYPPMEAFIPYLRIPRDKTKKVGCFGSFGWAGGALKHLTQMLAAEGYNLVPDPLAFNFFPDDAGLDECFEFGRRAAGWAQQESTAGEEKAAN